VLEPLMKTRIFQHGFTMIELMVVIAVVAILAVLAVPSLVNTLAKKRLEGAAAELATDIEYARSEAVHRNAAAGVVFAANCYTIYVLGSTNATNCTTLGTGATQLKTVQVGNGVSLNLVPVTAGNAFIAFDPVRGMAIDAGAGATDLSGYIDVTSSSGNWQVRNLVTRVGRVKTCSPNSTIGLLATDCN
jgi:type IV fimbrial biogenesis protein FimT